MEKRYCYASDEENGYKGDCPTVDEAKAECIREEEIDIGQKFWVAEIKPFVPHICADTILEQLDEQAAEECGEHSENWGLTSLKPEQREDLSQNLNASFGAWMIKHNKLPVNFYSINNAHEFTRTE